jgi:hypothetical protein
VRERRKKAPRPVEIELFFGWYPGSLDVAGAAPIMLSAGQHLSDLEIRLRRGNFHAIRGTLTGLDSIPVPAGGNPFGRRDIEARPASRAGGSIGRDISPNGSFEIPGIAPGTYDVYVVQGFPRFNLGAVKVQVRDRDVENLSIQLTRRVRSRG